MIRAILILTFSALAIQVLVAKEVNNPVRVFLWFDTEDYILPESDEALLRIARFLTEEDVRATFKIVGEKARVLEQRDRRDVLGALDHHDIGYHTDFHSVQPTPAMYLSPLGWEEGVEEFSRREYQGMLDLERITGQHPSCYGQPGSSWGPQQYGALQNWGIPVYLDAGEHIDLNGEPLWYGRTLTLFSLKHTIRTELGGEADLSQAKADFESAYRDLQAQGGGIISIYYHPCEFVHEEFWDGTNFVDGANPPREEWKLPPMKDANAIETAYSTFEAYVRYIKTFPGVRFTTAREAPDLYPDTARELRIGATDILELARKISSGNLIFQEIEGKTLSLSEVFYLLVSAADRLIEQRPVDLSLDIETPWGPFNPPPRPITVSTDLSQFRRTLADVLDHLRSEQRVPDAVWVGSQAVSPDSFLVATAQFVVDQLEGKTSPQMISISPKTADFSSYIRNDDGLWGWVIFPKGFNAPEMMELARRQGWTLKPAVPTWKEPR